MKLWLCFFGALAPTVAGACGDDGGAGGDAADTTSADTSDTGAGDVADTAGDAIAACAPGQSDSGTPDGDGLVLQVCGVRLTVAPDGLASGASVTLTIVEAPAPAPFERQLVSPVVQVTTGDGTDFAIPAELFVPDTSDAGGYRESVYYEQALSTWSGFEACPAEGGVTFGVTFGGTFALLRDTIVFPDSPQELGSGTLTSDFQDEETTWDFVDGYAIHDLGSNGLRSATLIARRTPSEGRIVQLDIRLSETATHDFVPVQVSLLDTGDASGGWSWLEPVHGPPAASSLIAVDGDRIVGSLTVQMTQGEALAYMTVAVDVQTGRYRFPPEGICFPEG